MGLTAARALWATVLAVGCAGAAVALLLSQAGSNRPAAVRPIDPGAPIRLATEPPRGAATPVPVLPSESTPPPRTGARPVSLRIAAIDVTAPVASVGVDRRGEVAIPERVATVGWYRFSAAPGAGAGSTALVGHVDSAVQGEGAFFRLRDLTRGDRIVVAVAGGRKVAYLVVSLAQYPKTSVPLRQLFSRTGAPRLTLITCGGSFDAARRSYRDNVVVTAVPT
ncbi:MAG TPA: class F sortase [Jatrophihabitans sp.]|nr:class F sortase [Jatrophihabitans sp.]